MKTAFITGITGQDGSYLAEFLLEKGYDVHGMIRRNSSDYRERIAHLEGTKNFHLHFGHLGDSMSIISIINKVKPDEIYNLAAPEVLDYGSYTETLAAVSDIPFATRPVTVEEVLLLMVRCRVTVLSQP